MLCKFSLFAAFAATIPAANWLIGNVGDCSHGPCLIPVFPGIYAPSGVLMIGAALVLRDAIHEAMGVSWAAAAIAIGAFVSAFFAPPALVVASVSAFVVSEGLDLAVYAPLRRKSLPVAVLASGVVGSIADSAIFLWLAFGSLDFIAGQVIGKVGMSALAAAALTWWRK